MNRSKLWIHSRALLICLILSGTLTPLAAQERLDLKAHYDKSEHMITMRDGVKLFTSVYAPKDQSQKYPILMLRTPYGVAPYGQSGYKESIGPSQSQAFAREGYIIVYQDVRGRYLSEGEFVNVRPHKPQKIGPKDIDESTDTYDTIDWLVKNIPNNNGRVGMWGVSYPGFYVATGMIEAHPALKAVSPQAPIADWFIGDDFRHNGALFLAHAFRFFSSFGQPRPKPTTERAAGFDFPSPNGYQFYLDIGPLANVNKKHFKNNIAFWNELMEHGTYDRFWKERSLPQYLKQIKPAVMTVGGWFDAEDLYGALKVYEAVERQSPTTSNILVMGPWFHGGWARSDGDRLGDINFGSKTGEHYRNDVEFPFFNYHLKGKGSLSLPEAYVFETGSNQWRSFDQWPPRGARDLSIYLHANGKLSFEAPQSESAGAFDEYISDPAKPVPFLGSIAQNMTHDYMIADQRFAAMRPDVLVYESEPLTEDLTIAGPVTASLFVSTTGTDSDFVVKLIDVSPEDTPDPEPNPTELSMGGYAMLVRGEPMRAKFRNSFERPEPMTPGKVTRVEFAMPDTSHTFKKGHKIMVQVQSSWFPLVDRNPQKFTDIYKATEADFQKATQRVYRSKSAGSHVKVKALR